MKKSKLFIIGGVITAGILLTTGVSVVYALGKKEDNKLGTEESQVEVETTVKEQVSEVKLPQLDMPEMFQEDYFEQYGEIFQNFHEVNIVEKEYDKDSHLVKEIYKNNKEQTYAIKKYEYDQNGYLVKEQGYGSSETEEPNEVTSYEYDKDYNLVSKSYTCAGGLVEYTITYPMDGALAEQTDFGKTYDEHHNIIQELYYQNGTLEDGKLNTIQYAYQYDEQDRIVKGIKNSNDRIEFYQNEYDTNGQLTRKIVVDENRTIAELREFQYDNNGNIAKEVVKRILINWEAEPTLTGIDEATYQQLISLFVCDAEQYWNNWYVKALTSYYSTPEEINLNSLFRYSGSDLSASEEEVQYYMDTIIKKEEGSYIGALFCITEDNVNAVLEQYFGISLAQTKDGFSVFNYCPYYEKTGNYLMNLTETWVLPVSFTGATQLQNGDVELYYLFDEQESVVTLRNQNETWKIVSNKSVHGEEHPNAQWS